MLQLPATAIWRFCINHPLCKQSKQTIDYIAIVRRPESCRIFTFFNIFPATAEFVRLNWPEYIQFCFISGDGVEARVRKVCRLLLRQVWKLFEWQWPAQVHVWWAGQEELEAELCDPGCRRQGQQGESRHLSIGRESLLKGRALYRWLPH